MDGLLQYVSLLRVTIVLSNKGVSQTCSLNCFFLLSHGRKWSITL